MYRRYKKFSNPSCIQLWEMGLPPLQKLSKLVFSHLLRPRHFFASSSNFFIKFFHLTCKLHTFCQTTYNYFSTTCNFYPQKHAFACFLNPRSTKMSEKFSKNSRRRSLQVRIRLFSETQLHVNLQRLPSWENSSSSLAYLSTKPCLMFVTYHTYQTFFDKKSFRHYNTDIFQIWYIKEEYKWKIE